MADLTLARTERCAFSIGARARRMQPPIYARVHPVCAATAPGGFPTKMIYKTYPANRLTMACAAAALAILLGGSGCLHSDNDEMTNAVIAGEKPVSMEGNE